MKTTYIDTEDGGIICSKEAFAADVTVAKADGDTPAHIIAFVSSEAIDSDGDIVHQRRSKKGSGWNLERFNKSPVISWQHDLWTPHLSSPLTRAKVSKHATKGVGLFLNPLVFDEGDELAMLIDGKIRRGSLTEFSVGFKIVERETRMVEGQRMGLDIYGAELFETAVANRGANPETEVMAKRMLGRADVVRQVEAGGSAEIAELKDEIKELSDQMDLLLGAVKMLGDNADPDKAQKFMQEKSDKEKAVGNAAQEILDSLLGAGIAHSGS